MTIRPGVAAAPVAGAALTGGSGPADNGGVKAGRPRCNVDGGTGPSQPEAT